MKVIMENVEKLIKGDSFVGIVPETVEKKIILAQLRIAEGLVVSIKRGATLQDVKEQVENLKNEYGTEIAKGALKILFTTFKHKVKQYVHWNQVYGKVAY